MVNEVERIGRDTVRAHFWCVFFLGNLKASRDTRCGASFLIVAGDVDELMSGLRGPTYGWMPL
jgi:hypothetical protein